MGAKPWNGIGMAEPGMRSGCQNLERGRLQLLGFVGIRDPEAGPAESPSHPPIPTLPSLLRERRIPGAPRPRLCFLHPKHHLEFFGMPQNEIQQLPDPKISGGSRNHPEPAGIRALGSWTGMGKSLSSELTTDPGTIVGFFKLPSNPKLKKRGKTLPRLSRASRKDRDRSRDPRKSLIPRAGRGRSAGAARQPRAPIK